MVSKERREEVMRVMTERVSRDVREPFSLTAQILTRSSQVKIFLALPNADIELSKTT